MEMGPLMLRRSLVLVIFVVGISAKLNGQASPVATRVTNGQIGLGFSMANPDFGGNTLLKGGSIYGSLDFGQYIGIEGEIHDLKIITPRDIGESSYLLGVRAGFDRRRFHPYGKALAGLGNFSFNKPSYGSNSSSTHRMLAFGAGLDYRASRKINVRIFDIEFQRWPGFGAHGLTPVVGTSGLAYSF